MFKYMLRSSLIMVSIFLSFQLFGQVQANTVVENNPPFNNCSNSFIQVDGQLMCANYTFVGNTVNVVGFNITVDIDYSVGGICAPAIMPFTQVVDLGMLPAGTYNITVNGILNGTTNSTLMMSSTVTSCCGAIPGYTLNDVTVCIGEQVTMTNNSTGTTSQEWFENNVSVSTAVDHSFTPTTAGTYTFKLVVTDGICSDSVEQTVTVYDPPSVSSIVVNPTTPCIGEEYWLTGTATNAFSYNWYLDFVQIGSGQSTSAIAAGPGTHTLTLIVQSACADSMQTTVEFLAPPVISNSTPNYDACLGDALSLNATSTGATTEEWYENYVFVGTGSSYNTTPSMSGMYVYTYVASDGVCTDSTVTTVTVNDLPIVDLGPDTSSCTPITLDAGSGFASYEWQDMTTNQTIVADSGTYYVTVVDTIGCVGSDTIVVTNCASIEELNPLNVSVHPNPVTEILTIDMDHTNSQVFIRLFDAAGRIVKEEVVVNNSTIQLNCGDLESGTYLLNVQSEGVSSVAKIIRQ